MILMGTTHEEGIWGLSSISTNLINRKNPSLDGGFSDSNLHRPQVVFGVFSDPLGNKINFCLITEVPGKVESHNITSLNLGKKKILPDNFKGLSVIQHPNLACMYCKQPDPCPSWVPRKKAWKLLKWIFSENEMLDSKSAMLVTFSQFLSSQMHQ